MKKKDGKKSSRPSLSAYSKMPLSCDNTSNDSKDYLEVWYMKKNKKRKTLPDELCRRYPGCC